MKNKNNFYLQYLLLIYFGLFFLGKAFLDADDLEVFNLVISFYERLILIFLIL